VEAAAAERIIHGGFYGGEGESCDCDSVIVENLSGSCYCCVGGCCYDGSIFCRTVLC
jgi:hypothetical protein